MTPRSGKQQPRLALGSMTHAGLVRGSNEDSYAALLPPNAPAGSSGLLVVADGMGGHRAGDVASNTAVNEFVAALRAEPSAVSGEAMAAAAARANARVHFEAGRADRAGMGTTLTAALVSGSALHLVHVGDTRAYLARDGRLTQLTSDHTWVADRVRRGILSPGDAASHARRNVLVRALGVAAAVDVDIVTVELRAGDVLLLSSDGLHGVVDDAAICETLASHEPGSAAETLVRLANDAGGPDNVTVVVAAVLSTGPAAGTGHAAPDATVVDGPGVGALIAGAVKRLAGRS